MEKHANTFFPNDHVSLSPPGAKTASPDDIGVVTDANPETGTVNVTFSNGVQRWVPVNELHKV